MRGRRWWSAVTLVCALLALAAVVAVAATGGARSLAPPGGEPAGGQATESEAEPEGGDDFLAGQHMTGTNSPEVRYQDAIDEAQRIERAAEQAEAQAPRGRWEFAGPTNIGGRISGLAVDPTQPDTIYAAAASGGLWKSTDGGKVFESVWPDTLSQPVGAVAVDRNGRVWAGTGEPQPGGGSSTYAGEGVFTSDDGGKTWQKRGLEASQRIARIVIDPRDPNRVLIAAGGPLFTLGGQRGVYLTEDGGASFRRILEPETPTAGASEISIDPSNPDRIFVAMWDRIRTPSHRTYGGFGSGIYRSQDGGQTWERLENILERTPGDVHGLARGQRLGRVAVAVAPSNPQRVYAVTGSYSIYGGFTGFYVSNDGGDSFTTTAERPDPGGDLWWTGQVWVDPEDENHVLVPGVDLERSTDGGQSWQLSEEMHVDHHAIAWDPKVPDRLYEGNDGGVYRSDTNGTPDSWVKATHEPYTQHYTVDVAETNPDRITGGLQDQGSIRSWTPTTDPGLASWANYNGGDGLYTPIDWSDQNIYYGCSQYGNCARFDDRTPGVRTPISDGAVSRIFNWKSPLVIDPNDPKTLYFAGDVVNKSTNRGETWTPISPVTNPLPGMPTELDPTYFRFGTITTVAVSESVPGTLYAGTDTGRLWKTDNGGGNWTEITGLPKRWVSSVAIDPINRNRAFVTFTGFFQGDDNAHVYATTDGGRSWRNVSSNLPNAPVNDVVIDYRRNTVYVASDVGAFYLRNRRGNWKPVADGLPLAPVHDLRLHAPSATLYAGTFGRGAWKAPVPRR